MKNNSTLIVFLLTNLGYQVLIGQLGVYSIVKFPMATLFGYDEHFLGILYCYIGILDSIGLLGETVGSLFVLFISINPVKGFLFFSLFNVLIGLLFFVPRYTAINILRDFIVVFCIFFQAFILAALAFTQIIFSKYFNEDSKKF